MTPLQPFMLAVIRDPPDSRSTVRASRYTAPSRRSPTGRTNRYSGPAESPPTGRAALYTGPS